mgnify:CR=1 FL=1
MQAVPAGHSLNQGSQQQQSNTLNINMNIMNIGLTGVQPADLPIQDV